MDYDEVVSFALVVAEKIFTSKELTVAVVLLFVSLLMFVDILGIGHALSTPFAIVLLLCSLLLLVVGFTGAADPDKRMGM